VLLSGHALDDLDAVFGISGGILPEPGEQIFNYNRRD
jgi:hypothetical protein